MRAPISTPTALESRNATADRSTSTVAAWLALIASNRWVLPIGSLWKVPCCIFRCQERLRLGPRWLDHDLVFPHDGNKLGPEGMAGGYLNPEHVWRMLRTQQVAYNRTAEPGEESPLISVHELRHSWATLAMQAGVHVRVVQGRLGHTTVAITLGTYSHVSPTMQRAAAQLVAGAFLG